MRLVSCDVNLSERTVRRGEEKVMLSPLEARLLGYLGQRPDEVISREELLTEVWSYRAGVRTRAVDTAMKTLRRKVERDPSKPDHLLTVRGRGFRFVGAVFERRPRQFQERALPGKEEALQAAFDALLGGQDVWVHGPPGVGHSAFIETVAARWQRQQAGPVQLVPASRLGAFSVQPGTLVVVDDVAGRRDALLTACRDLPQGTRVLAASVAPDEPTGWQRVRLDPLDAKVSSELENQQVRLLARHADGLPMFVQELGERCHLLGARELYRQLGVSADPHGQDPVFPCGVGRVRSMLARLPEHQVQDWRCLAVFTGAFRADEALQLLTAGGRGLAQERFEEVLRWGVVRAVSDCPGWFRLLAPVRRALGATPIAAATVHADLVTARVLAALPPRRGAPPPRAEDLERALTSRIGASAPGVLSEIVAALVQVVEWSEEPPVSIAVLNRVLGLRGLSVADRQRLQIAFLRLRHWTGAELELVEGLRRLEKAWSEIEPVVRRHLGEALACALIHRGSYQEAGDLLAPLVGQERDGPSSRWLAALVALADLKHRGGAAAEAQCRDAIVVLEDNGQWGPVASARIDLAFWLRSQGRVADGIATLELVLRRGAGRADFEAVANMNLGILLFDMAEPRRGLAFMKTSVAIHKLMSGDRALGRALSNVAVVSFAVGERRRALVLAEQAYDVLVRAADTAGLAALLDERAHWHLSGGALGSAAADLRRARALGVEEPAWIAVALDIRQLELERLRGSTSVEALSERLGDPRLLEIQMPAPLRTRLIAVRETEAREQSVGAAPAGLLQWAGEQNEEF